MCDLRSLSLYAVSVSLPSERPDRRTPLIGTEPATQELNTELIPGNAVLVSTLDVGGLRRLKVRLHGRSEVILVRDPVTLWKEARRRESLVVLVDACAPAIEPTEIATRLGSLSDRCTVVVWGATRELRERLAKRENTHRWMHIDEGTTPQQLAELIASLF